tara:strand:- start:5918 stop:6139 length:222 start_codon:yes stop_codon:yes gene_type:complete
MFRAARHTHIPGRRTVSAGLAVDSNCAALQELWEGSNCGVVVLEAGVVDRLVGIGLVVAWLAGGASLVVAVAG